MSRDAAGSNRFITIDKITSDHRLRVVCAARIDRLGGAPAEHRSWADRWVGCVARRISPWMAWRTCGDLTGGWGL